MNGVLVVDKPSGPSSHDVVAVFRRATRLQRVGHTGTLDPLATGVLPLVVGRATRLAQFLSGADKTYDAELRLGVTTDTFDETGTVIASAPLEGPFERAVIERTLASFLGTFLQEPPPFSAKSVDGVRAYRLARRRAPVTLKPVPVTVHVLQLIEAANDRLRVRVVCSAGFYVRALAHAIGQQLGVGATLRSLRRIASGQFGIESAVSLGMLQESPSAALARLIPVDRLLPGLPGVVLNEVGARRAAHGNLIRAEDVEQGAAPARGPVRLLDPNGSLLAIARAGLESGTLRPSVVLV